MRINPIPPKPGQESAWDYPRPAIVEDTDKRLKVICQDITLAETIRGKRVLETSHPPTYYFPAADIKLEHLIKATKRGVCEWKGRYEYYDISISNQTIPAAAWRYFDPTPNFVSIQECYGFVATLMDACFVNDEQITPQSGDFYGGWITADVVGPFKGEPGTWGW